METEPAAEAPWLAIHLALDPAVIAELAAHLDELLGVPQMAPVTLLSTPIDGRTLSK